MIVKRSLGGGGINKEKIRELKKETSVKVEKGKDLDRPDFFDTFRIVSEMTVPTWVFPLAADWNNL